MRQVAGPIQDVRRHGDGGPNGLLQERLPWRTPLGKRPIVTQIAALNGIVHGLLGDRRRREARSLAFFVPVSPHRQCVHPLDVQLVLIGGCGGFVQDRRFAPFLGRTRMECVEVTCVSDPALLNEQFDDFGTQPVDVHGLSADKMLNAPQHLRRTRGLVWAIMLGLSHLPNQRRAALWASRDVHEGFG